MILICLERLPCRELKLIQPKPYARKGIEIMPKKMVIDANFILALTNIEEYSPQAKKIYELIKSGNLIAYAPTFLIVEVLNVLIKKKKANSILVKKALERIKKSKIIFVNTDDFVKNSSELENLVFKYSITSYDALYLLVTLKNKCKLLTTDEELLKIKNLTIKLQDSNS